MKIKALKSKIHNARVTDANLEYEGSISIDPRLLDRVGLQVYEKVHVLDLSNGARVETYVIKGEPNSGEICINGAAAHLIKTGNIVIILSYATFSKEELTKHRPSIIFLDENNKPVD